MPQAPRTKLPPLGPGHFYYKNPHPLQFQHPSDDSNTLIKMIRNHTNGDKALFLGPFGKRKAIYVDHTASGQSLNCIEVFIDKYVLPHYANTHTVGNYNATQTSSYRNECRDIVRKAVSASSEDVVIFCGTGATSAIHKIVHAVSTSVSDLKLTVFVGLFEHHSNILPWREIGADVVLIPDTVYGSLDIDFLEARLNEASNSSNGSSRLIGSFSAASNVTGIVTDSIRVTILLHKYGALSLWDYSAAAPHCQIIMNPLINNPNPRQQELAKKDAIFFSGHKFQGGPQTPGVLVAKNILFDSNRPHGAGGGTVLYVTQNSHNYLKNTEEREEGGTPGIVESIRLGLLFKLKESVGPKQIVSREATLIRNILEDWKTVPQIKILGPTELPRVPIISFMIQHLPSGYYIHHNFVVALLNDLFGIQCRGGCACAGPYGAVLLGIPDKMINQYENLLVNNAELGSKVELVKPGFVRISFTYFSSTSEVQFVSQAVKLIARHGWRLLPLYEFSVTTGEFRHHSYNFSDHQKSMALVRYDGTGIKYGDNVKTNSTNSRIPPRNSECLSIAKKNLSTALKLSKTRASSIQTLKLDTSVIHLRWFMLPEESLSFQNEPKSYKIRSPMPFQVKTYAEPGNEHKKYYKQSVPGQIQQSTQDIEIQ